jgi:hypothetical protein
LILNTTKEKWMRGMNTAAEALTLAVQLVESARQRARNAGKGAERVVRDFRNDAACRAEALGKTAAEKLRTRPSTGTKALQFFTGIGLGIAAGVLFTPAAGKETRERLYSKATRLMNREDYSSNQRMSG